MIEEIQTIITRVIVRHKDSYLILRKAKPSKRAGRWELPGGHLEQNESLEAGARRELFEETGIRAARVDYVKSEWYTFEKKRRLGVIFELEVASDVVKISDEHEDYAWIDMSNYNNISFEKNYRDIFDEIFKTEVSTSIKNNNGAKTTTNMDVMIAYTDGGSRGNPGPSATGYVLMNDKREVLEEGGEYIGITTNNQAEYQAVKLALKQASKFKPQKIEFYIDSLLVVNQMNGIFKIKNRDLWPIHENIKELSSHFLEVTYTHVKREKNKPADAQVNIVLDSYEHGDVNSSDKA